MIKLGLFSYSFLLLLWGSFSIASAATHTVTTDTDSGASSLRQAIIDASLGDKIKFDADYTINLSSSLVINKNLTIDGSGKDITISGQGQVLVLKIQSGTEVNINNLAIIDGKGSYGAGIRNYGKLTLRKITFFNNVSNVHGSSFGGGIFNDTTGNLTVKNCIFKDNYAYNTGGGLYNYFDGKVTVENSTFIGNSSYDGGGIRNFGTMSVNNSTFFNNKATGNGGGILNNKILEVNNSTLFKNTAPLGKGGGLANHGSELHLKNTIIAENSGGDCAASMVTNLNNLIKDGSCNPLITGEPLLAAQPGDYGGAVPVVPLLPGSPAIDAGNACASTDARGVARPQGTSCDIGAFESHGFRLEIVDGNLQSTPVATAFNTNLQVSVTPKDANEPVADGQVTFTPPSVGASLDPNTPMRVGINSDKLVELAILANEEAGEYIVKANCWGAEQPLEFALTNNGPPSALNVNMTGNLIIGETMMGNYTYQDAEDDLESGTIFQWYVSPVPACPDSNRSAIVDATAPSYTLTVNELGQYLCFEVTPQAVTGALTGTAVTTVGAVPVAKQSQTTSFNAFSDKFYPSLPFPVSATASSGLAVSFSASGNCTINGNLVTLIGIGTCSLTASQSGNEEYAPATEVIRSFAIFPVPSTIPTPPPPKPSPVTTQISLTASIPEPSAVNQAVNWHFTVTTANGDIVPMGKVVVSDDAGNQCDDLITVTDGGLGSCVITFNHTGNYQLIAKYEGDAHFQKSVSAPKKHTVNDVVILVTESANHTELSEGNTVDSYSLSINIPPTGEVTVTASADNQTEISLDNANYAGTQRITLRDTVPQTVYVRAKDDNWVEGWHQSIIHHEVTKSEDPIYPVTLPVAEVITTILDNDPGVIITPLQLSLEEGQAGKSYTIQLSTVPLEKVMIEVIAGTQLTTSTARLEFNADRTALVPQTVTVAALEDILYEELHTGKIQHMLREGDNLEYSSATPIAEVMADISDGPAYTLRFNQTGNGNGTINGKKIYAVGATVNLSATPQTNSIFSGWSPTPCAETFTMPAHDLTCTATFDLIPLYTLTLTNSGEGTGTVSGGGNYAADTPVQLNATPTSGSVFTGWSPASCAKTFTMPAHDLTCTAMFDLIPLYTLTVINDSEGLGTVSSDKKTYAADTPVQLNAIPTSNSIFTSWSPAPCAETFTMPAHDLTCTAKFQTTVTYDPPPTTNADAQFTGKIWSSSGRVGKRLSIDAPEAITVTGFIQPSSQHIGQFADIKVIYDWKSATTDQSLTIPVTLVSQQPLVTSMEFNLFEGYLIGLAGQFEIRLGYQLNNGIFLYDHILSLQVTPNHAPTAINLSEHTVLEYSLTNTLIGSFTTTDPDNQEQFRYGLVVNPGDYFKIVDDELRVNHSLPSQKDQSFYRIQVRSVDQSGSLIEQPFLIQVLPVATSPSEIRLTQNTVKENSLGGAVIGRLWTLDLQPDHYSYELLDDAQGRFTLKGDLLQVAPEATLDFETQPLHMITVRSWNSSPLVTMEQTFTIQVLNQIDVTVLAAPNNQYVQQLLTADWHHRDEVEITIQVLPEQSHQGKKAKFMQVMLWLPLASNEIFMYRLQGTQWVPWQGNLAELLTDKTFTLQNQHELTLVLKPPFNWNQGELQMMVGYQLVTGEIFYAAVPW